MRAQLFKQTIKALYPIKRPVCIEGAPGGGKTTIVQELAEEMGVGYIHRHMPTMLVEDFGILFPKKEGDKLEYKLPDWFPTEGEGFICFDDRNQCGADLQKVMANLTQERELHGHQLPEGWHIISTGNRMSDRAGANRVLSHLRNRETVIELDTNLDDWCHWAIDHGVTADVVSFLRFRPNLLHDFDPQRDQNATPRSWVEGVSQVLGVIPAESEYECFKGAVGEGPAAEFVGFMKIVWKLPNPDTIIENPTTSDVPSDPATLYALAGALAERADTTNFDNVVEYLSRCPAEFSVLGVSFAARKNTALASTKAFTNWAVEHKDVLF